jgi:hypothetical protein
LSISEEEEEEEQEPKTKEKHVEHSDESSIDEFASGKSEILLEKPQKQKETQQVIKRQRHCFFLLSSQ